MKRNIVILSLAGLLAACVTINIYFPAAAAQEVADEIINDVWQLQEGDDSKKVETSDAEPAATESTGSTKTTESK